jgi:hypothetical protein
LIDDIKRYIKQLKLKEWLKGDEEEEQEEQDDLLDTKQKKLSKESEDENLTITKYSMRDTIKGEIDKIRKVDQNYKNKNVFIEKLSCSETKILLSVRSDGIDKIVNHEGSQLSTILFWLNKVPNFSEAEFKL